MTVTSRTAGWWRLAVETFHALEILWRELKRRATNFFLIQTWMEVRLLFMIGTGGWGHCFSSDCHVTDGFGKCCSLIVVCELGSRCLKPRTKETSLEAERDWRQFWSVFIVWAYIRFAVSVSAGQGCKIGMCLVLRFVYTAEVSSIIRRLCRRKACLDCLLLWQKGCTWCWVYPQLWSLYQRLKDVNDKLWHFWEAAVFCSKDEHCARHREIFQQILSRLVWLRLYNGWL